MKEVMTNFIGSSHSEGTKETIEESSLRESNLFFVYGTLKRHCGNHYLLKSSEFLGKFITEQPFNMWSGGCPFIRLHMSGKPIVGELYKVTESKVVRQLDCLESNGSLYTRKIFNVKKFPGDTNEGEEVSKLKAWIYETESWILQRSSPPDKLLNTLFHEWKSPYARGDS